MARQPSALRGRIRCTLAIALAALLAAPAGAGLTDRFDQQIERNRWYLPTADGAAKLYVTEVGSGPPVVFLHGGPGNDFHYILDAIAPQLDRHRFVLFDQRGSLLSPVAPDRLDAITFARMVEDIETLRIALHQDKLVLFGHSFGSVLAMAYYRAHPDRVARLVLTGSFSPTATLAATVAAMRPRQRALRERADVAAMLRANRLDGDQAALTPQQISDRARIALAAVNIVDLSRWREVPGGGVFYNAALDGRIGSTIPDDLDTGPTLIAHPIPVAVIQGDRDYVDPGATGWTAFAARNPALPIRVTIVPKASHYAWIDDSAVFADALDRALDR